MQITVEFFGIPRQRAGRAILEVSLPGRKDSATLGEILQALSRELPDFARDCLADHRLKPGYIANISGKHFVSAPETPIAAGESLLILSADVGG